jgi:hypothetical protein
MSTIMILEFEGDIDYALTEFENSLEHTRSKYKTWFSDGYYNAKYGNAISSLFPEKIQKIMQAIKEGKEALG